MSEQAKEEQKHLTMKRMHLKKGSELDQCFGNFIQDVPISRHTIS